MGSDLNNLDGGQLRIAQNSSGDRSANWLFVEAPAPTTPDGRDGWFQILNLGATAAGCTDLSRTAPGKVITYPCHGTGTAGSDNQLWRFLPDPINGGYTIHSANDMSALTAGTNTADLVTTQTTNPSPWTFHIQ